ncbi:MAG: hypothetical protein JWR34_5265 [Mycobacterium sp.]|nr:hypothetical protein [Mycobacterium sp.]
MLDRRTRWQLWVFAVVTVLTVGATVLFYLRVPAALGIGTYNVTANFAASGGLYENANVTYRGTTVGTVEAVKLTHDKGVEAHLRLNSRNRIPDNVIATVKSVSAIGEQYVDLVPPAEATQGALRDGSRIARDHTAISQDVAGLLREAEKLADSLDESRLRDLLRETFKAFDGSGPELARLIESSRLLVDEANAHSTEATQLIDQAGPFLDAQIRSGDDIKSLANSLARLTGEVRTADPQIRTLLGTVPTVADQATQTITGVRASFPMLAASLANIGRVGVIYHKSIEQTLVILPAAFAVSTSAAGALPPDEGTKSDFKLNFGDPPPCTTGFIAPPLIRSPADETLRELPKDLYCKVAQNDPTVVRGARNYPCQEFPGKRAPTIQLCRDPQGYVPPGNNPWRGPPVPIGTPITDGRNILPPNKFPNLPPDADYDPGPPVVQLPPGVPPGPGPALTPPYPLPVPPATPGPQPPPLPYQAPLDQMIPPYGRPLPSPPLPAEEPSSPPPVPDPAAPPTADAPQPQASGLAYATYDKKNGMFLDTNGDIGVYRAGGGMHLAPENWVDLMTYPRAQ